MLSPKDSSTGWEGKRLPLHGSRPPFCQKSPRARAGRRPPRPLRPSVRRHRPMRKRGTCQRNLRLFFVFELKVLKLGRVAKLARQQLELLGMEFTTLEVIERCRADDTRHACRRLMR